MNAPAAPALAARPTLTALLELALVRNPRIAAARARAAAAAETAAIEGALPDPKLMLGWYETSVETRVGPQEFSAGIQQTIPFPSKLRLRARLGRATADRAVLVYESVVRDVLTDIVRTAHELVYLDRAARISRDIGALVERYAALAAGETDGSPLSELFRAETQRAQLDNDRVVLAELRAVETERLRALLDLPADAAVGTPVVGPTPDVALSYADLLAFARRHNQELAAAGVDVRAAALRAELARQARRPDLTLGFTRIFTGASPVGNPPGNGDDPQIVTLGLTMPLWASKNRARIRRARALEHAAVRARDDADAALRTRLARVWFEVGNARRLVRLYETVLIPRAETAARTGEDLRTASKGTLAGVLETAAVLHNFRLAAARARADYGRAVAELESVLGSPLAREEEGR